MRDVSEETNPRLGIFFALLTYLLVAVMGLADKDLIYPVPVSIVLFYQSAVCLVCTLPGAIKSGFTPSAKTAGVYMLRVTMGILCYGSLFYILQFMPLSESLLFQYSGTLWIPLISLVWMGIHLSTRNWFLLLIGFLGLLLLLKPEGDYSTSVVMAGVLCGFLQGLTVVSVRWLTVSEPIDRVLFYYFFVGTVITLPFIFIDKLHLGVHDTVLLIAIGILTYLIQFFIAKSLRYIHANTLAPFCYVGVMLSVAFDLILLHKMPGAIALVGMSLVMVSGLLTSYFKLSR